LDVLQGEANKERILEPKVKRGRKSQQPAKRKRKGGANWEGKRQGWHRQKGDPGKGLPSSGKGWIQGREGRNKEGRAAQAKSGGNRRLRGQKGWGTYKAGA